LKLGRRRQIKNTGYRKQDRENRIEDIGDLAEIIIRADVPFKV